MLTSAGDSETVARGLGGAQKSSCFEVGGFAFRSRLATTLAVSRLEGGGNVAVALIGACRPMRV